jgi:hypothetical protein
MTSPHCARRLLALLATALLCACAQQPKQIYLWENFPRQQYEVLLRSGVNVSEQVQALEAHAEKARAANAPLPPGLRAHLGMLYLELGNVDAARNAWQAEKAAFPESAPYMDQLLRRLDAPRKS